MMRRLLLLGAALVLVVFSWLLPSPVLASQYSITPPLVIDLLTFSVATDYTSADDTVTASTNDGKMITVDIGVADVSGNLGFLKNGAVAFTNALQAKGGDVGTYTDVTATDIMLVTGGTIVGGDYTIYDFSVQQTIVVGDLTKPPGVYSTILTFTATFNP